MHLGAIIQKYLCNFNAVILFIFTFQNSSAILLSSYTQQRFDALPAAEREAKKFAPLHLLMLTELGKLLVSLVWAAVDIGRDIRLSTSHVQSAAVPPATVAVHTRRPDETEGSSPFGSTVSRAMGEVQRTTGHSTAMLTAMMMLSSSSSSSSRKVHFEVAEPLLSGGEQKERNGGHAIAGREDEEISVSIYPMRRGAALSANGLPGGGLRHRFGGAQRRFFAAFWDRYTTEVCVVYCKPVPPRGTETITASVSGEFAEDGFLESALPKGKLDGTRYDGCESNEKHKRRAFQKLFFSPLLSRLNPEAFYMAVPAIAYAIQNICMLDALSKLSPLVYQVTVQLRILMTAVAMKVIMETVITRKKWIALLLLFVGVVLGRVGAAPARSAAVIVADRYSIDGEQNNFVTMAVNRPTPPPLTRTETLTTAPNGPLTTFLNDLLHTALPFSTRSVDHQNRESEIAVDHTPRLSPPPFLRPDGDAAFAKKIVGNASLALSQGETIAAVAAANTRFLSGLTSLFLGCCISVLSSVYMEAVFKKRSRNAFLSTRNVHLAFFSVLYFGLLSLKEFQSQKNEIEQALARNHFDKELGSLPSSSTSHHARVIVGANGSFQYKNKTFYIHFSSYLSNYLANFDALVWMLMLVNIFGGMLIALLFRYSDNIMKTMSTAAAIVVSGAGSYLLFDEQLTSLFLLGAALVLAAVLMYNLS